MSLAVVPPLGEAVDYGEELFVVYCIIELGRLKFPRVIGDWMQGVVGGGLG